MVDLEIPLGKRTLMYRLFEMLPAFLSYGALILLVILSFFSPILAAIYLLLVIVTLLVKAVGVAIHTIQGRNRMEQAQKVNWHQRLLDLETPSKSYEKFKADNIELKEYGISEHINNLRLISSQSEEYPLPSQIYNAVIIATYNESYEVLEPTIQSVLDSSYDPKRIILNIAYEERGGATTKDNAKSCRLNLKIVLWRLILSSTLKICQMR